MKITSSLFLLFLVVGCNAVSTRPVVDKDVTASDVIAEDATPPGVTEIQNLLVRAEQTEGQQLDVLLDILNEIRELREQNEVILERFPESPTQELIVPPAEETDAVESKGDPLAEPDSTQVPDPPAASVSLPDTPSQAVEPEPAPVVQPVAVTRTRRVQTGTRRVRMKFCQNGRCWYEWVNQPVYSEETYTEWVTPTTTAPLPPQTSVDRVGWVQPYAIYKGKKYYGRVCDRSWCDMCNDIEWQIKNFKQPGDAFFTSKTSEPLFPDGRNPLLSAGEQPLRMEMVRRMLAVGDAGSSDIHFDAGCGDGRICVEAIRRFGVKHSYGVEINPTLAAKAKENIKRLGLEDRITINPDGITDMFDFNPAKYGVTLVTAHHFNDLLDQLKPQLSRVSKAVTTHPVDGLAMRQSSDLYVYRRQS